MAIFSEDALNGIDILFFMNAAGYVFACNYAVKRNNMHTKSHIPVFMKKDKANSRKAYK